MGWAEIIKAVNSNISIPLNKLITSAKDSLDASITSAKNELSTLIKKNGTSYPNVIAGKIGPGESLEITGKGKILAKDRMNGITTNVIIDGVQCPENLFQTYQALYMTFTFQNSVSFRNTQSKASDADYYIAYIVQLSD